MGFHHTFKVKLLNIFILEAVGTEVDSSVDASLLDGRFDKLLTSVGSEERTIVVSAVVVFVGAGEIG